MSQVFITEMIALAVAESAAVISVVITQRQAAILIVSRAQGGGGQIVSQLRITGFHWTLGPLLQAGPDGLFRDQRVTKRREIGAHVRHHVDALLAQV